MEVNMILSVVNQDTADIMQQLYQSAGLNLILNLRGNGTARDEHLNLYGLQSTEKRVLVSFGTQEQTRQLIPSARLRLFLDIPGHGIILSVPIKSIGGGKTLAYLTNNAPMTAEKPDENYSHELIMVIANEGYTDDVMNAARAAGARGGTILHAKGSGSAGAETFLGVSLADERELLMIVASAQEKPDIMKAIIRNCGPSTPAGAICLSLPVTQVAGLRTATNDFRQ